MTDTDETAERTMGDVSHTNPYTGETFGYSFRRGPAVADGGERTDGSAGARRATDDAMADVDHTPREGDGANEVWARGRGGVDE